ncbi:hypothetical protein [Solidesulfovibrio sp.]|uniref:hypothetical protein n=1 Tax=Solidesulfovibrio sp. TaxID=2910990 RepID=UPI00262E0237|nr:hypothetical protein [Solidesulfovibrio sp.]
MSPEPFFLPAWMSLLIGLVLFFTRKWVADVARAIDGLDARLRALEKTQADCRVDLARGYATRAEMERVAERLESHATRLTILEERDLAA